MKISKLHISNFKSFRNLDVSLTDLSVLVGANASGKSNFVNSLRFLRDIVNHGLEHAIAIQGGVEYLRNTKIGNSADLSFNVTMEDENVSFRPFKSQVISTSVGTSYYFRIRFHKRGIGFRVEEDRLVHKYSFSKSKKNGDKDKKREIIGTGSVTTSNKRGKVRFTTKLPPGLSYDSVIFHPFIEGQSIGTKSLIIEHAFLRNPFSQMFDDISIYNFNPTISKRACQITGLPELSENGENIAFVIQKVLRNKESKRRFMNLLRELLPFITDTDTQRLADKSLLLRLKEKYSDKTFLPSLLISDGTINLIANIYALYFDDKPITVIEEPERNIHPHLINSLVEMINDASQNKQVIITSHNPEVLNHVDIENILLMTRCSDGYSTVSKPSEKEDIKIFLENEIGIGELLVDNLLEI